jgi:hypothetical protein
MTRGAPFARSVDAGGLANVLAVALLVALDPGCAGAKVDRPPPPPLRVSAPAAAGPAPSAPPADAAPPAESPAAPPARAEPPLGWIAGKALEPEELLVEWGDVASRELWLVIDKLVATRLALAEATRLGIRLEPEEVERRFQGEREKLARDVQGDGQTRADTLEAYIQRELGFDPARYLERVRRATIRQMLAERAVRAASLAEESVALRLVVVAEGEAVERVRSALAAGRDFAAVAREFSIDDSRARDGLVPFVAQEERSPLSRIAFQTPVGEVAGPIPIGEHHFWIRVEERRAPLAGDWTALSEPVEASLARHPVEDSEFVHWKLVTERRYPIDLGPLWSLIGAAR